MSSKQLFYLACPYSHPDPKIKKERLQAVTHAAYQLFTKGTYVYSPLTHNVPIDRLGIHGDWNKWKDFDHAMMARCDGVIVLKLDGWEESQSFVQSSDDLQKIEEEIGDVFAVLIHLANILGIDPIKAADQKLAKTAFRYPVERCRGLCAKYTI